eukprot:CAMPEP_0196767178 /NCGR_PEP_ID=MMETSP1095-20130614/37043_1 /TAXON_ID=96789 ORGANISM="Chromulina nebulosa, Strain UTEXLB2642" /NCGR_SAMPLE_ID=MMETSP1095 /ASSEMBLY_ACC=CAM_ASM_000446 /LENGTH=281 /DNA_ID=CAMNT_0042133849 /DNA_START=81 /DNA_END=926 /DNA_ORIENTATION=+
MPLPFYRILELTDPNMVGNDVLIASTLLSRDDAVSSDFTPTNTFTASTLKATLEFQKANGLDLTGEVDEFTAQALLDLHGDDQYTDSGFTAESMGYLYKFHLPFYYNRSVESVGTLYDKYNNVLLTFPIRGHGHRSDGSNIPWPDFGVNDVGLNQFTTNGNTVTGLIEVDLNSPEPYTPEYGPWPINRLVRGLDGNALLLLPNIRDGLLIHTGNWTTEEYGQWYPTKDMPNSSGCIHTYPSKIYEIYQQLLKLGVVVNDNTFSGKNYPYTPQGIAVVEQID